MTVFRLRGLGRIRLPPQMVMSLFRGFGAPSLLQGESLPVPPLQATPGVSCHPPLPRHPSVCPTPSPPPQSHLVRNPGCGEMAAQVEINRERGLRDQTGEFSPLRELQLSAGKTSKTGETRSDLFCFLAHNCTMLKSGKGVTERWEEKDSSVFPQQHLCASLVQKENQTEISFVVFPLHQKNFGIFFVRTGHL